VALGNAQSPDVEAELYWCLTYITGWLPGFAFYAFECMCLRVCIEITSVLVVTVARRAALPFFVEQGIIPAMVTCLARCSEVEDYMVRLT